MRTQGRIAVTDHGLGSARRSSVGARRLPRGLRRRCMWDVHGCPSPDQEVPTHMAPHQLYHDCIFLSCTYVFGQDCASSRSDVTRYLGSSKNRGQNELALEKKTRDNSRPVNMHAFCNAECADLHINNARQRKSKGGL